MAGRSARENPPNDLTRTLVIRLRGGDVDAGQLLDELYRTHLQRFCRAYLGSEHEAEDAVQEVFFKVLRSDVVPEHFRAWVYALARNHCLDVLRRRGRRRDDEDLPPDSQLGEDLTGNLTRLIRGEQHSRVRHLVESLSAAHREVLRLRYVERLSRVEMAHVLGLPESVVKSRLFEAMEKLRRHRDRLADR